MPTKTDDYERQQQAVGHPPILAKVNWIRKRFVVSLTMEKKVTCHQRIMIELITIIHLRILRHLPKEKALSRGSCKNYAINTLFNTFRKLFIKRGDNLSFHYSEFWWKVLTNECLCSTLLRQSPPSHSCAQMGPKTTLLCAWLLRPLFQKDDISRRASFSCGYRL